MPKLSKRIAALILIFISSAFLLLIYSFIVSDFSILLVANNSHTNSPLIYKIAATWGNHEGSMLLWVLVLTLFNYIYAVFKPQDIVTLCIHGIIILLFLIYNIFYCDPFIAIHPAPLHGLGLNPILQDIGLTLHPPILYFGYVGFSITYASAIGAMLRKQASEIWINDIKRFVMLSWSFLTIGIGLGSWWAYRELGWGGYWFWDPVENASLIPYLAATALFHSFKVKELSKLSFVLAILTFSMCVVGTFLVRSGIVMSVHSFAFDSQKGIALFIIMGVLSMGGLGVFACCAGNYNTRGTTQTQRGNLLLLNTILLITATIIIILGTIFPIIMEVFFKETASIKAQYYNKLLRPIVLGLLILLMQYKWKKSLLCLSLIPTIITCIGLHITEILYISFLILGYYVVLSSIRASASSFGHLGFALIIVSITINASVEIEKEVQLKVNEFIEIGKFKLVLTDIKYAQGPNYLYRSGDIDVYSKGKLLGKLMPQVRLYVTEKQLLTESAIYHTFLYDIYVIIGDMDEEGNLAVLAYIRGPISFIWVGCIFIFIAGMWKIMFYKYRKKNKI